MNLDPDNIPALIHKGQTLQLLDKHDEAIEIFTFSLNYNSDLLDAINGIATSYLGQEKNHDAEEYVLRAIQLDSLDCISVQNFALFKYRIDEKTIAYQYANRANELCSDVKNRSLMDSIIAQVCD